MSTIVMKFGGTSVGSPDRIKRVANRILNEKKQGYNVVVVVSAMGNTTDTLFQLAEDMTTQPNKREMDVLLSTGEQVTSSLITMALQAKGGDAISLTGWQAGIQTESVFSNAAIVSIDATRIKEELSHGTIVVVAGFQGISSGGDICTLGRGGSDTTAAALAAELNSERCDIFTDVDGIYTSDPRGVPQATKINKIAYNDMMNLAEQGASVLHPRAVRYAQRYQVPLVVCSSFKTDRGTKVGDTDGVNRGDSVIGITFEDEITRITVYERNEEKFSRSTIRQTLSSSHIPVKGEAEESTGSFSFLIRNKDLYKSLSLLNRKKDKLGLEAIRHENGLATVAIVKRHIHSQLKWKDSIGEILTKQGVKTVCLKQSSGCFSIIVDATQMHEAARRLHTAFGLDCSCKEPAMV